MNSHRHMTIYYTPSNVDIANTLPILPTSNKKDTRKSLGCREIPQERFIKVPRCNINFFLQRGFVRTSACCSSVPTCNTRTSPARIKPLIMKWSFTPICLLRDALLGLPEIAFAPSLSPKISTLIPVRSGCRNTKTALVNRASLDASHEVTYLASHVAVVTHF